MVVYRVTTKYTNGKSYRMSEIFTEDINLAHRVQDTAREDGYMSIMHRIVVKPDEFDNQDDMILACLNRAGYAYEAEGVYDEN